MTDLNQEYLLEQFQLVEEFLRRARHGWRAPQSKAEAFEILGEQGILSEDVVEAFREASRFRNLVTYQTAVVRDEVVYQILQEHLTDFERFLSLVARWLGGDPAALPSS